MTRIRLMMGDDCNFCHEIEQKFSKEIAEGKIELINLDTQEGVDFVDEVRKQGFDFEDIPQCLLTEVDGKMEVFNCENIEQVLKEKVD